MYNVLVIRRSGITYIGKLYSKLTGRVGSEQLQVPRQHKGISTSCITQLERGKGREGKGVEGRQVQVPVPQQIHNKSCHADPIFIQLRLTIVFIQLRFTIVLRLHTVHSRHHAFVREAGSGKIRAAKRLPLLINTIVDCVVCVV